MSVSIKYKGNTIASASTEVTKTIKTAGKYCEADILVENTPDGGDAPVINPLSVTANGTYTAPSGVDGYSPVTVNVPQGITPSGKKLITDTSETDVAAFATAQVSSGTLLAENIKKDVNILGVIGTFEGGGSLPPSISKIDGGSFTLAADTTQNVYRISHSLGVAPKGVMVWTLDNDEWGVGTNSTTIFYIGFNHTYYNGETSQMGGGYYEAYRASNGNADKSSNVLIPTQAANAFRANVFQVIVGHYFKGGATYNWIVWA